MATKTKKPKKTTEPRGGLGGGIAWKSKIVGHDRVPPDQLVANPLNYRKHPQAQRDALKAAIEEVGFIRSVTVNKRTGNLVDGHERVWQALTSDQPLIDVEYVDLSEEEERLALATMDPISEMATVDGQILDQLLRDTNTGNEHLQQLLSDMAQDAGILDGLTSGEVVEDEIPPAPVDPITKPGDLWILGEHRLLCGDSTSAKDVERLMGGERAGLMNTDPPYGVSYANDERPNPGVAKPRVANDGLSDEKLQQFLESAFRAAVDTALTADAAWYLWHAHLTQGYFAAAAAAAAANVVLHRQIIWVKPVLLLGRGQYHWKHEPCFMGWVKGNQPPDYGKGNGERTQTTIWELKGVNQADRKEFDHATPKPVELFAIPIVKHLKHGEICYEPFSGSAPQIIAAEQLGRRCFAMELSPKYCDVAVARWEKLTGKEATRA